MLFSIVSCPTPLLMPSLGAGQHLMPPADRALGAGQRLMPPADRALGAGQRVMPPVDRTLGAGLRLMPPADRAWGLAACAHSGKGRVCIIICKFTHFLCERQR